MGILSLFKKKTTSERIAAKRTNCVGESMDHLDKDGELPFGWVVHNQKYVDMIEAEIEPFRQAIWKAKTDIQKHAALKSYVLYLQDGKKHYYKYGECVGKYFEEYICNSCEGEQLTKAFKELDKKLKEQK